MSSSGRLPVAAGVVTLTALTALVVMRIAVSPSDALVVYCAHDSIYSSDILRRFEEKTGIRVTPVFDSEATKSLGLVERLKREADAPRADVFWNNEMMGSIDLARQNLLLPYKSEGWSRRAEGIRDEDGMWAPFAARLRVVAAPASASPGGEFLDPVPADASTVAMAKPLYGTTFTHYLVLRDAWGMERLKKWHAEIRARGLVEATGNSHVMRLVAGGSCSLGATDTDDYFLSRDNGSDCTMTPVTVNGLAIFIPNTCGIVRGTARVNAARKLIDYLLSDECELALARSGSRQIPLGGVDESLIPEEVRPLAAYAPRAYPLKRASTHITEVLEWLRSEYTR